MSEKNTTELKYDAFISYRHSELDMFVAKNLHREMEAFRLPRNVARKMGENSKTRITRVFRDKDELPLASNLAEPIQIALAASDFLVVICSPRLPESTWCKKEIETFLELNGRDHILAVLIEGEPDESFPDILCYDHGVPIEPLAADVRGSSEKEIKKKIKQEIIRLAAPMFGCAYDELKQRHRERKIKRILTLCGIGSAICLLFGTISTSMALTINKQKNEISKQSEQIVAQKDEIEKQYTTAMISNAEMTAKEALSMIEEGDRIGAVKKVRSVLPGTKENAEIPYVDDAEFALCQALQPYANGNNLLAKENLKHDTNVSFMLISPDKKKLASIDDSALITIWDIESGKAILTIEDFMSEVFLDKSQIAFTDNDHIACLHRDNYNSDEPDVEIYDIVTGTAAPISVEDAYYLLSDGNGQLVVANRNKVQLFKNGKAVSTWTQEDEYMFVGSAYAFNEDGSRFAFAQSHDKDVYDGRVVVLDTATGEVTNCYDTEYDLFKELRFVGDTLYVANNQNLFEITKDFGEAVANYISTNGRISACNLNTYDEFRWQYETDKINLNGLVPSGEEDSNILLVNGYSDAFAIDATNGSFVSSYSFDDKIVETGSIADSKWFIVYTRTGNINMLKLVDDQLIATQSAVTDAFQVSSLKEVYTGSGNIISLADSDTDITLWSYLKGKNIEESKCISESIYNAQFCDQKNLLLLEGASDNEFILQNTQTGQQQGNLKFSKDYCHNSCFVGEQGEQIALLAGSHVELFDTEDGSLLKQYDIEGLATESSFAGANNDFIVMTYHDKMDVMDTMTGELLHEIPIEESLGTNDYMAVNADGTLIATSSATDKKITLYLTEDGSRLFDLPIHASFIANMFFHRDDTDQLFVSFKDGTVDIYQVKDNQLSLYYEIPALKVAPSTISEGKDGYYALISSTVSYYMHGTDILAEVPQLLAVQWENQEFLTSDGQTIFKTPIYSYEELIQMADEYIEQHKE